MWKRYDQIFNLSKFKADNRLLDVEFEEITDDSETTTLATGLDPEDLDCVQNNEYLYLDKS